MTIQAAWLHYSGRGSQYLSIDYTQQLAQAGIELLVGSVGDSYDNARADDSIPPHISPSP